MIPVNILIALWAALVAAGFIFGSPFPTGTSLRIAEFLSPFSIYLPHPPRAAEWAGRLAAPFASMSLALLLAAAARGAGRTASGFLVFPGPMKWWLSYAAGGGLLSFILFGLGLTGLLFQPLVYLLFTPFCAAGLRGWSPRGTPGASPSWLRLSSAVVLAAWVLGVLVPEPGIDAYLYHLRLPFYYLLHHRIYSVWHQIHGHVPQIWEFLLAAFPRGLSATGAQALSALSALAVWKMALEKGGGGWSGWSASSVSPATPADETGETQFARANRPGANWGYKAGLILVMSSPLLVGTGTSAYTDLPLMWLEFGSFILLVKPSGVPSQSARFWAGAVLGLATSLKYASFPAFAAGAVLLAVQSFRLRSPRYLIPAVAGFSAVFWPWLGWNALETGNPFFPFLGSFFPGALHSLPFADRLSEAVFNRTVWNMFQSPWNALVRCEPFLFLTPALIASVPVLLSKKSRDPFPPLAGAWAVSFIIAWSVFMADERFILGVIPALLILLPRLDSFRAGKALFALLLALNLYGCLRQVLVPLDRLWTAVGLASRQEYLRRRIGPSPGYMAMAEWLNSNTGGPDRILFVSDFKSPYIWRECIHDHVYDYPTRLVYLLWNTPRDPGRVAVRFRQMGIRWVVYLPTVNQARLAQIPDLFPFDPVTSRAWAGFWERYAVPRAAFPPVFVYGITPHPGPARNLYHLPGVGDAAMANADDLGRTRGQAEFIDYLRRLSKAYPRVGEFHRKLGEALMASPATEQEGREQIAMSEKVVKP